MKPVEMKPTIIYASIWYLLTESENAVWFACGVVFTLVLQLVFAAIKKPRKAQLSRNGGIK